MRIDIGIATPDYSSISNKLGTIHKLEHQLLTIIFKKKYRLYNLAKLI